MMRSTTPQQYGSVRSPQSPPASSYITPESNDQSAGLNGTLRRKGSFSFLRRSKSRERSVSTGSVPQRKLSKKDRARVREEEMRQMQIPDRPPRIPDVPSQPELQSFGGEDARSENVAIMSNRAGGSFQNRLAQKTSQENVGSGYYRGMPIPPVPPIPPIPSHMIGKAAYVDPLLREESMANRGRYSYASSAISTINSPRKIRRRKDPTPFNILVLGSRGAGKTAFLSFLQSSLSLPTSKWRQSTRDPYEDPPSPSEAAFPNFTSHYVETEIEGERIGVTLWDSEGLEKSVVDLQLKETTTFLESKFEVTYMEESKVARAPGFRDTHIHCVFMILDPLRLDANIAADQKAKLVDGAKAKANSFVKSRPEPTPSGLDEDLDLNVLRALKGKTTVIPIISKADTITTAHMTHLKRAVWTSLKENGLETLEAVDKDDDDNGSDTSTEYGDQRHALDERDEEHANAIDNFNSNPRNDADEYSKTSHLDSPSSSGSSFKSADFDLAKPGKLAKGLERRRSSSPEVPALPEQHSIPLSVLSPDPCDPRIVGRKFPWGFADPYNSEHCDFTKLKELIFTEWRSDLREASRELWYERWRTSRLDRKSKRHAVSLGVNEVQTKVWAGHNQPWAYERGHVGQI